MTLSLFFSDCFLSYRDVLNLGAVPRDLPVVRVAVVGGTVTMIGGYKYAKHVLNIAVSPIPYKIPV
jgi:hypothetical protein